MSDGLLDSRIIRMPEFAPGKWLNIDRPLTREQLHGRVVLVDFWDYSCINCLRTLPYLTRWHDRYADKGLTIVGVHSPEFKFAHLQAQVESALTEYHIQYPVLLDNNFETWSRFANKAWPTKYLIDAQGYIRFKRQGEGYYRDTEQAIQTLLRQLDPNVSLPTLLPPLRQEDAPGAVCFRPTPELYAGFQGGGLFGGALGNSEGYVPHNPVFYQLPDAEVREAGRFYVDGVWRAGPEALSYAGQGGGKLVLPYQAATVNGVFSPSADPVEMMLNLWPTKVDPVIEVRQDGHFLTETISGTDVLFKEDGTSFIRVTRPRMYELVRNTYYEWHELELTFRAFGLALYTFTFTTCLAPDLAVGQNNTFQVK